MRGARWCNHFKEKSVSAGNVSCWGWPAAAITIGARAQCEQNVLYMHRMDELYTQYPFFGSRRMTQWLRREGHAVGRGRIQRLMRQMGLEAIYPRRNLSQGHRQHRIFPYLLRGLAVERPDQVWCSDITYLRLSRGFLFLTVVLDWFSRYVLSWQLSTPWRAASVCSPWRKL